MTLGSSRPHYNHAAMPPRSLQQILDLGVSLCQQQRFADAENLYRSAAAEYPSNAPLLTIPGGIGLYRDSIELSFGAEPGKGFSAQIQMRGVSLRIGANGDGLMTVDGFNELSVELGNRAQ